MANQVFYDVTTGRQALQLQTADAIDTKLATVFTVGGAVPALFGALIALTSLPHGGAGIAFWVFIGLGVAAYCASLIFSFLGYWARAYAVRPELGALRLNAQNHDDDWLRHAVAEQCMLSVRENDGVLQHKAHWFRASMAALPFEVLFLLGASLVLLASK